MQNVFPRCLVVILFAAAAASCKKDREADGEEETAVCRITAIDIRNGADSARAEAVYNAEGRLMSLTRRSFRPDVVRRSIYAYSGNEVYIRHTSNVQGTILDTVVLNSNGQVLTHVGHDSITGTRVRTEYIYVGAEVQRMTVLSTGISVRIDTVRYEWNGGNMERETHLDGYTVSYTYDTARVVDNSDIYRFFSVADFGGPIITSRNLVKTITSSGNNHYVWTYLFDPVGRVSEATVSSGTNATHYRLTYSCR